MSSVRQAEYMRTWRLERMSQRVLGDNGRWFAPNCPPDKHGTWTGVNWQCECTPCLSLRNSKSRNVAARRRANRAILVQINRDHALPTATGSSPAPEEDPADQDARPSREVPTAPSVDVEPARVPPGPTDYIAEVRAKLAGILR